LKLATHQLEDGYRAEFTCLGAEEWHQLLQRFDDSNICQTLSYGLKRWPKSALNHLLLKRDDELVAVAQLRLIPVPLLKGIVYLRWGPLWRRHGRAEDVDVFRQALRSIKTEYIERLGYTVQLVPRETDDRADLIRILEQEGFHSTVQDYNTLIIDISGSEDEIRSRLVPRWRTDLNRSQRNELVLTEGDQIELYDRFAPIYLEMYERKNLVEFGDLDAYRDIQSDLPANLKMKIMLCSRNGEPDGAGVITSAMGDTGLAILWATNHRGRDDKGAYYLQWQVIRWLKQQGCRYYDLGGVSKQQNPGGYRFKIGLAGKKGRETRFAGQFQAGPSRLHGLALDAAFGARNGLRKLRGIISR
jgi:lipid II:glycine glycyltransferase (peptidoglycan interpeptide bridge formation enzyme)